MEPFRASKKLRSDWSAAGVRRFAKPPPPPAVGRQHRPLRLPVLVLVLDQRVRPLMDERTCTTIAEAPWPVLRFGREPGILRDQRSGAQLKAGELAPVRVRFGRGHRRALDQSRVVRDGLDRLALE